MSWYTTEGKDPHHTLRSEVQYIRNFAALPFSDRAPENQRRALFSELEKLLEANGFKKEPLPEGVIHKLSYAEKGYLDTCGFSSSSKEDIAYDHDCSLFFNEPCSLAVTVGGKDHISIRSLLSGRAIKEAKSIASEAEELFDKKFEFAYSHHFGYLSPCPYRCGSGEILSAILFLPALSLSNETADVERYCRRQGVTFSPTFTYKGNPGDMFTLKYSPHHLSDRRAAASGFDALISGIIEKEKQYEGIIFAERCKIITDKAYRALGAMTYAQSMSEEEMLCHLSSLRLLCAASPDKKESHAVKLPKINLIFAECLNASVASTSGGIGSYEELEEKRATRLKELLCDKKSDTAAISASKKA